MCIGIANGGKMPKEMTDKEIIKALECCTASKQICPENCPLVNDTECGVKVKENALDLINRQQSAIDVYMQENDRLKTAYIQVSMDRDEAKQRLRG